MPFVKDLMVAFGVVRGGAVIATQENAIGFSHDDSSPPGTLGPVSLVSVIWNLQDVAALFEIPPAPDGVGTIRPRRPDEIPGPSLPLYTSMWTTGGTVDVTFNHDFGSDTITIHLRTIPTIDLLALRAGAIDPLLVAAPAPFDSYVWSASGATGLSVSAPFPGVSATFAVDGSAAWGTDPALTWNLTIRSQRGVASVPTKDSTATFTTGVSPRRPTVTLRQPQARDDGALALTGYTFFFGQTGTARGVDLTIPTPPTGTLTRRATVGGVEIGTFDADLRFTAGTILPSVPFGAAPAAMIIEIAHSQTAWPLVTFSAEIASRRMDDALAPLTDPITIPNPSGSITVRVEDDAAHDWIDVIELVGATTTLSPLPFVPVNNAGTLALAFAPLGAGETGTLAVTLRPTGPGRVRSIGASIGASVAMAPIPDIPIGPSPLPGGRALMLYETKLTATPPTVLVAGQEYFWQVVSPAGFAFPTPVTAVPENNLRATDYLLAAWGGTSQPIIVKVSKQPSGGGAAIEGGNNVTLQLPVAASKDPSNVAIVLDRSGSMTVNTAGSTRWFKAVSGAHFFANQIAAENLSRGVAPKHELAVLWFGGWDTATDNYTGPVTDPWGEGNFGILTSNLMPLDFADPSALYLTNLDAAKNSAEASTIPKFWTAIGAGLLYGREKLYTKEPVAAAAATRERVLVCLSDGEENRPPNVMTATDPLGAPPRWRAAPAGDPNVRVYAAAVATTTGAANTLRTAITNTGGIASIDVKEMGDDATLIQQWFGNTFAALFGYSTIVAGYDPTLSSGATDAHVLEVTSAHTRVVATLFLAAPQAPGDWEISIEPPGGGEIMEADAAALPSVELRTGPLYRSLIVDLPLQIPGYEDRLSGNWTFRVRRHAAGSGDYIVNAMAKANVRADVRVIGPASPATGDTVRLRADLSYDGGKPLDDAQVRVLVTPPGVWRDGIVAAAASSTPVTTDPDGGIAWQNATQALAQAGHFTDGPPIHMVLHSVGGGGYEGDLSLTIAGGWSIDTTIHGRLPTRPRPPHGGGHGHGHGEHGPDEIEAGRPFETFVIEKRQTLAVRLVPSPRRSLGGGIARGAELDLWVRPRALGDMVLGAGHASAIYFEHEDLPGRSWPARDNGDGTYSAQVILRSRTSTFVIERDLGKIIGHGLEFDDPHTGKPVRRFHDQLRTRGWVAIALGVRIPLAVRHRLQPIGPGRAKHLPPRYAMAVGAAMLTAESARPGRELDEREKRALHALEHTFERTIDVRFFPSKVAAAWIPGALAGMALAVETALSDLHDTPIGPAFIALSTACEAARDRLRAIALEPCASERAIFETWEDVRVATDAIRQALRVHGKEHATAR